MTTPAKASSGGAVLVGALVIDSVGTGLFLPLSLIYFVRLTDVGLGLLGVLISIAGAVAFPMPIWAGALADRFGAFPVVVAAQLMQALGYLAYAWVGEPVGIFLATCLVTIGMRFFWSTVFTAVVDFADGSASGMSKDSWLAVANTARNGGLALGGLITGAVVAGGEVTAYRAIAYCVAGCFGLAAAAIALFVRAPRRPVSDADEPGAGYRTLLRDRPFLMLIGINTAFAMTSMMLALGLPTLVLIGLHGPAWLASAVLVGNTVLITVLATPVVKRLAPYRRTRVIMAAAALWAGWSFLFAVLLPGEHIWVIPVLIAATVLFTVAEVMHAPVSMALVAVIAPISVRGRYLATFQYSFALAQVIAPAYFTTLFEIHRALPWVGLGLINCLSILAMLGWERRVPASARPAETVGERR
ncbi:MAG TPA: MFS transporter [Actinophytocola sp.]|uniref:MFS transporter n=1 Tax=Actinophytocola sp. TaxID=1872138 RepID=UPI002DDCC9D8|nr:MFS transporter [Actinophytocola sp.]HEV2778237.1 MFS transporter [Actinophytocola sp.]